MAVQPTRRGQARRYVRVHEYASSSLNTYAQKGRRETSLGDVRRSRVNIYGFFYLLAGLAVFANYFVRTRMHRLPISVAVDSAIFAIPLAMLTSHVAFALLVPEQTGDLRNMFLTLRGWKSGYLSFGGVFGVLFGLALAAKLHRQRFLFVADLAAPGLFLASVLGRLGCFFKGCCYGAPSDVPWGIRFPVETQPGQITPPSHPVQLYEAGLSLIAFLAIVTVLPRSSVRPGRGKVLAICLLVYFAIRFVEEFFRIGGTSHQTQVGLSTAQMLTLGGILVCGIYLRAVRPVS